MMPPSVSICFPAYNERATIRAVLEDAHRLLADAPFDYEILVCDDASTDGTGEIIESMRVEIPRLRVIRHAVNQGIFATFEELYREATKDLIFLNSTDRQWETAILFDLLPRLTDADVVIARRRDKHYGPLRALISWAYNALPRLLFGVTTYDAGAVKLMRREIISRFPIISRSQFSEAERLIRAARGGYRIVECPVTTAPRRTGQARGAKVAVVVRSAIDVVRVWWDLRAYNR